MIVEKHSIASGVLRFAQNSMLKPRSGLSPPWQMVEGLGAGRYNAGKHENL
jgi:hypothetical protein